MWIPLKEGIGCERRPKDRVTLQITLLCQILVNGFNQKLEEPWNIMKSPRGGFVQGKGTPTTTRDLAQDNNCILPALPIYKVKLNIIITLNISRAWGGGERFLHLLLKSGKDLTPIHRHKIHPTLREYVWHPFLIF